MAAGWVGDAMQGLWRSKRIGVLAAALTLWACAIAPQPLYVPIATGRSYGYKDIDLAGASYRVVYHAPRQETYAMYGHSERDQVAEGRLAIAYDLALRRAVEIAVARGVSAFAVTDRQNNVTERERVEPLFDPFYDEPVFYRDRFGRRRLLHPWPPQPRYDRINEIGVSVQLTIEPRETAEGDALPARATLERLQRLYPDPPIPAL